MKIVLLIKQVPETSAVRMDKATGTIIRKAADAIVNPLDLYAVETALRLKDATGAEIVAISMGPLAAEKALREVVAMGVDRGILISDRVFAGSDTWATSHILAAAVRVAAPDFDLILCGERATDGDTGQVGPETAAALDIPAVTYASKLGAYRDNRLRLVRLVDGASETLTVRCPALVSVVKAIATPRLPTLDNKIAARQAEIKTLSQKDLGLPPDQVGLAGSPTRVVAIFHPQLTRTCDVMQATDDVSTTTAVRALQRLLTGKGLL